MVCPICRAMAERVFDISERQPGVNFPPFHPWCRCTFEIVVDDWDAWMDEYVAKHSGDCLVVQDVEGGAQAMCIAHTRIDRDRKQRTRHQNSGKTEEDKFYPAAGTDR